eukprot:GEMP01101353.1.p1 GENE.GEMP01101353.1~~GEMP01101353.1.p1  ORF type:complete len:165 (+),score=24.64 GEMP01101353.1:38-532(+)
MHLSGRLRAMASANQFSSRIKQYIDVKTRDGKGRWSRHVVPNLNVLDSRVEDGSSTAEFKLRVKDDMCNSMGTPHGGFLSTIVDDATSLAAMAADAEGRMTISTDISVSFLGKAAIGSDLIIKCVVEKAGRTMAFCTAHVVDSEGKRIILGKHSMVYLAERQFP